jgi:hypothetical protein
MTASYAGHNRPMSILLIVWPVCAFVLFAALAIVRGPSPAGYVRAAVVLPIILVVPGALTLCAIFGQQRRPTGITFVGYAVLLSVAWMAFVSLGLYLMRILITTNSTYWALLTLCGILTVVAERRLFSERQACRYSESQDLQSESDNVRPGDSVRPFVILGGALAALVLLFGGVYYYEHGPHPASRGYAELGWTNVGQQDTVAVGSAGSHLEFEIISQQSLTRFRLSAEWEGRSSHVLAAPVTFSMGMDKTYHGSIFVPSPADSCMYRVVLTMVAIGQRDPLTGHQQTWTLNANIHKQGVSRDACLYSRTILLHAAGA